MPKRKNKYGAWVEVEMTVDVHIPFRSRLFLKQNRRYTVDSQVAGYLLEGRYASQVV